MNKAQRGLKGRNPELAAAMREIRRSSAATPHANKSRYNRERDNRNWRRDVQSA